jgi:hypothetical protein
MSRERVDLFDEPEFGEAEFFNDRFWGARRTLAKWSDLRKVAANVTLQNVTTITATVPAVSSFIKANSLRTSILRDAASTVISK